MGLAGRIPDARQVREADAELQHSFDRAVEGGDEFSIACSHRVMAQVDWRGGDLDEGLRVMAEHARAVLRGDRPPGRGWR